jgi:integrase
MAKGIPFLIKKRDIYYLQKRVPKKLVRTIGREFVRLSLRTKDKATAIRTAGPILAALERDWHYQLFAIPTGTNVLDHFGPDASNEPTLVEAAASYVEMKARAEDRKFTNPTNLVINAIVQQSGNKVISAYVRSDAVRFRDNLIQRGVSQATVKRNLSIIRSIWNFAAREHGISKANPFANMNYGNASGPITRLPIPLSSIRLVQQQCVDIDDDIRWLIGIISDSGLRLSEAAGLIISDIHLSANIPYVTVKEHAWRQLKTSPSRRDIPLIGMSLWGVKQAIWFVVGWVGLLN